MTKSIYLAGPDVFFQNPIEIGKKKKEICERYGFKGHYPFDNEISGIDDPIKLAYEISRLNEELIEKSDIVVANLTPFRGVSADVGTVYELGYARGLRKEVHGYSCNTHNYKQKVMSMYPGYKTHDPDDNMIESFGLTDNLMIEGGIKLSGGIFIAAQADNLKLFEKLIQQIHIIHYPIGY